jgi:predicted DsbA family dithiol-disulfide isomerase
MTLENTAKPIVVDIVSDVVCPWCFVGKRRLEQAVAEDGGDVEVRWHPFQLDPTIPAGGLDRTTYLERKFGDPGRIAQIHERLEQTGREVGIPFAFDRIRRSPNTRDAHRVIRWAHTVGRQNEVAETLFRLYFIEGVDIGDRAVLVRAAADNGLDPATVTRLLEDGSDIDAVEQEIATAVRLGVSGVPFFIFASSFAVPGAQSPDVLRTALGKARHPETEPLPA